MTTYLCTFERTALREGWPKANLASLLAPFLSGDAQKAYYELNTKQVANYNCLKRAVLSHYGYSLARRAQLVHDWRFVAEASPRAQMSDLLCITTAWLLTHIATLHVIDKAVMNRFLRVLPHMKRAANLRAQTLENIL